ALQLDAVNEEDRHRDLLLADVIEKSILKVLRFFAGHLWPLLAVTVEVRTVAPSTFYVTQSGRPRPPPIPLRCPTHKSYSCTPESGCLPARRSRRRPQASSG